MATENPYPDWEKYDSYSITNNPGPGHQASLTVIYKTGMNADFSDLRFSDSNNNIIPYWIEEKTDNTSAKVWVKLTADTTINVYYGKSSASSESNGENVFLFFDDFPGTALNTSKWTVTTASAFTVANSICTCTGTDSPAQPFLKSNATFNYTGLAVEAKLNITALGSTSSSGWTMRFIGSKTDGINWYTGNARYVMFNSIGTTDSDPTGRGMTVSSDRVTMKKLSGSLSMTTLNWTESWTGTTEDTAKYLHIFQTRANYVIAVDWVFVRQAVATEPTFTLNESQELLQKSFISSSDILLDILCSSGNDIFINKLFSSSSDIDLIKSLLSINDILINKQFSGISDIFINKPISSSNDIQIQKAFSSFNSVLKSLLQIAFESSNDIQVQKTFSNSNDLYIYKLFSSNNDINALLQAIFTSSNNIILGKSFNLSNDLLVSQTFLSSNDIILILNNLFASSNDIILNSHFSSSNDIRITKIFSSANDIILFVATSDFNYPLTVVISKIKRSVVISRVERSVVISQKKRTVSIDQ